jgi:hypothetical protein
LINAILRNKCAGIFPRGFRKFYRFAKRLLNYRHRRQEGFPLLQCFAARVDRVQSTLFPGRLDDLIGVRGLLALAQSSRRFGRQARRNPEAMRPLGAADPDHETIADVRKDNRDKNITRARQAGASAARRASHSL